MKLEMKATNEQIGRAAAEWSQLAGGEPIWVEQILGNLYAYGSELAVRRLAHKFRSFNIGYSEYAKSWYFCNENQPK